METISLSPLPIDPSLDLEVKVEFDESFISLSGTSSTSSSFSNSSPIYGPFTPLSGRSTPHRPLEVDFSPSSSYSNNNNSSSSSSSSNSNNRHNLQQSLPLSMSPPPMHAGGYFASDPAFKTDTMDRMNYLGVCMPESYHQQQQHHHHNQQQQNQHQHHNHQHHNHQHQQHQSSQSRRQEMAPNPHALGLEYDGVMDLQMSQPYPIPGAQGVPPSASPYDMDQHMRSTHFSHSHAHPAPPVCLPDMCAMPPYPFDSPPDPRGSAASMSSSSWAAALSSGEHYRASDTESVTSQVALMSPIEPSSSPELQKRMFMGDSRTREPSSGRPSHGLDRRTARASENEYDDEDTSIGLIEIKRISPGGFRCKHMDCHKSFNRKEHLKRHITTTHGAVKFECPFCKDKSIKPFNRYDNYKHHIKIHAQPRSHGRVLYVPAAVEYYREMVAKSKTRKPSKKSSSGSMDGTPSSLLKQ